MKDVPGLYAEFRDRFPAIIEKNERSVDCIRDVMTKPAADSKLMPALI